MKVCADACKQNWIFLVDQNILQLSVNNILNILIGMNWLNKYIGGFKTPPENPLPWLRVLKPHQKPHIRGCQYQNPTRKPTCVVLSIKTPPETPRKPPTEIAR